jgi:beta-galactosidase
MKKINFNAGWSFIFEKHLDAFNTFGFDKYSDAAGAAGRFYDHNNWEKIDLPHDWAVRLTKTPQANTFAGAYPNTSYHRFTEERRSGVEPIYDIGWYRKQFSFDPAWEGKRIWIEFEGVFRDAAVWVNGVYLDRHTSGYTGFALELTDHLVSDGDNSIAVRVDSGQPEGWWYEGSGIYRNVNLLIGEPTYFKYNQTVVRTDNDGTVYASAIAVNDRAVEAQKTILWRVLDVNNNEVACTQTVAELVPYGETAVQSSLKVDAPQRWSPDEPNLYTLEMVLDEEKTQVTFGFRTFVFDADRGLIVNGKPLKVRGACVHQDFGGVGVALSDNLNEYKIRRLKEMGVNAYRCSHHAPSPALLDACDRLGMLVMDETRMFGTAPEAVRQLTDLIERDRNHPCVFIWALGNEEFSVQNKPWSYRLMEKVTRLAKKLDPTRAVTYGGNNGENVMGANGASEIRGVNYIRNGQTGDWLDVYHKEHPHQPIIGTEEASNVLSRGGAINDLGNGKIDSTGNVTMPWGSTPKGWVKAFEERDFLAGSFMWTGFDYRGEPNPLYYSHTVSSFGAMDLCGMEKPPFYYYKAWWTDESVLKLAPHWNHKDGEDVTVAVFTNCERITLSLNGRDIETREVKRFDAPLFTLPFESGELTVTGVRGDEVLTDTLITAGETAQVQCRLILDAKDESDVAIYQIEAYDAQGRFCPLASEELELRAENGQIIGVGNGDPSSLDPEQMMPEEQAVFLRSFSHNGEAWFVPEKAPNTKRKRYDWIEYEEKGNAFEDDFRLVAQYCNNKEPEHTEEYTAVLDNVDGYEYIEFERLGSSMEIYLNGEKIGDNLRKHAARNTNRPYRFYCKFSKGENILKIVCNCMESDPPPMSGYVKIGRMVPPVWRVKLHYGKARVFVKSKTPELVVLRARHSYPQ